MDDPLVRRAGDENFIILYQLLETPVYYQV